jgi:alpha-beta hydrolase superfamily lysophospholipase
MPPARRQHLSSGAVAHSWTAPVARGIAVVQHGYGEYAERFVDEHGHLVSRLVDAGFDVWALDLWGHGASPGTRGVTHVGRAVQDHVELRHLAADRRLPVLLLGHSLGGLVTAGSVTTDPVGLAGVVLTSAALPSEAAAVRRILGWAAAIAPGAPIPQRAASLSGLSHDEQVVARATADPQMTHRQVPLRLAATAIDVSDSVTAAASAWTTPTLVFHGSDDTYTDPQDSRRVFDSLGAEDKTLRIVQGGFHELFHDTGGHQLVGDVIEWMSIRRDRALKTEDTR